MTDPTSERAALAVLDRMLDDLPVRPAPHLDAGEPAGRRRRPLVVAGSVAAVLALVVGLGMALRGGSPGPEPPPADLPTRQIGIGQVTVEVPADWPTKSSYCAGARPGIVYFPGGYEPDCGPPGRSSVYVTSSRPFRANEDMRDDGEVGGYGVVRTGASCSPPLDVGCRQVIGVPDLHAWFAVTALERDGGEALVEEIRDSLTVLPEGRTTVPPTFLYGESQAEYVQRLRSAGFVVHVARRSCRGRPGCSGFDVRPVAGTVLPVGATVRVLKP